MTKQRSKLEAAAGQLILAIQKEWQAELGDERARESELVMHTSHDLLAAAQSNTLESFLAGRTIAQYLGASWVGRHPRVVPLIKELHLQMKGEHAV